MSDPTVGIGAVVDRLRSEFPDVSVSKLRYLEARGLIRPDRSPKGTRRFDTGDVARLREILRLQRDEFLPLEVIAARMESWTPRPTQGAPEGPLTAFDLADRVGVEVGVIEELAAHGLLRPVDGRFAPPSLDISRGAAELLAEGLEPRHLRLLRSGVEQVTEKMAGTTRAVARGRSGDAARGELIDRLEQAVRLVLGGVAKEEFGRLRAE